MAYFTRDGDEERTGGEGRGARRNVTTLIERTDSSNTHLFLGLFIKFIGEHIFRHSLMKEVLGFHKSDVFEDMLV